MLSIVVYGRNDSHGYNLSRRAALGLNCLAEVLTAPADEIIFVDYNTPDELPSFPEAIADTLTRTALERLRVIRVRPGHHAPGGRAVIEPVARNVGIRRSNPANRWILSTNADMILVPKRESWLEGLEPRLHHLPRFELPQGAWERLDRRNPAQALDFLRRWGGRMGLHTALTMHDFLLYDAPGDFQLFPRDDAFAIHGFDEAMRLGWHVDSNLAKRLALLRGAPGSCADRLLAYHCEHSRHADTLHHHDHAEDDWRRFVDDVAAPGLERQAGTWGLAGVDLEAFRLPRGTAGDFAGFVASVLEVPHPGLREDGALYRFDDRDYAPETVAPFLADLLEGMDRGLSAGYAGISPQAYAMFRRVWSALGFSGAVAVHPLSRTLAGAGEGDFHAAALFVLEVGALPDPGPDETALADLHDALHDIAAAEAERARQGLAPRRVVILNGHRNRMAGYIDTLVACTRGPSVLRLKHGFVKGLDAGPEPPSPRLVMRLLEAAGDRTQGVPVTEAVRLLTGLHEIAEGAMAPQRAELILHGAASLATLCRTASIRHCYGDAIAERMLHWIEANRASSRLAAGLAVPVVERPAPRSVAAPCRLATVEDWEEDAFIAFVRHDLVGRFAENRLKRCRTAWATAHVVLQLAAHDVLGAGRVLVVTAGASDLPAVLSRHLDGVDVAGQWDGPASQDVIARPERIRRFDPQQVHDAVCLTGGPSALAFGRDHVRPGGLVAMIAEVPLDAPLPEPDCPGLARLGAAPREFSRLSLDMCVTDGTAGAHFVSLRDGRPVTSGCWFYERRA